MGKYIPLSLIVMTVALPIALARRKNAAVTLQRQYLFLAVYILVWGFLCMNFYPRYVFIE